MINPVSSSSATLETAQAHRPPSPAQQPASNPPQDSVQLSSHAVSAGDVDHDGDSH
jgi:hypothetical protein